MTRKVVTSTHQSIQTFEVGYEIFVSHVCSFVNCILVNGGDKRRLPAEVSGDKRRPPVEVSGDKRRPPVEVTSETSCLAHGSLNPGYQ